MAEQERLTNKERRAQARDERKRKEAEAAKKRKQGQLRNGLITFAVVAIIGAVVFQAVSSGGGGLDRDSDEEIVLAANEMDDLRAAAGCEVLEEGTPLEDRSHVETSAQVNADASYTATRPTHSGPHPVGVHPVTPAASSQIDEVAATHNLEHGTIIAWWDPDEVDNDAQGQIGDWATWLNDNGFRRDQAGIGIMSAPYEDPGIESGKNIAFRAWGTAMDCDEWDEDVALGFVLDHYGTHGIGPERTMAPFPDGVLTYDDGEVQDTSEDEAPIDGSTPPDEIGIEDLDIDPSDLDGLDDADDADADDADADEADDAADDES